MVSDCQVFFLVRGLFHLKVKIDLQHKKNSPNTYSYKIFNVRYQEDKRSKIGLISTFIYWNSLPQNVRQAEALNNLKHF